MVTEQEWKLKAGGVWMTLFVSKFEVWAIVPVLFTFTMLVMSARPSLVLTLGTPDGLDFAIEACSVPLRMFDVVLRWDNDVPL